MGRKRSGKTNRIGFMRAYRLDRIIKLRAGPCGLRGRQKAAALLQRLKAAFFRGRQRDGQLCNVRQLASLRSSPCGCKQQRIVAP